MNVNLSVALPKSQDSLYFGEEFKVSPKIIKASTCKRELTPQLLTIEILQQLSFTKQEAENITYSSGSKKVGKILSEKYHCLKERGYSNDDIKCIAARDNGCARLRTVLETHDVLIQYFKKKNIVKMASYYDAPRTLRLLSEMYPELQDYRPRFRKIVQIISRPKAYHRLKELFDKQPVVENEFDRTTLTKTSQNKSTQARKSSCKYIPKPLEQPTSSVECTRSFNWVAHFEDYDELSYLQTDIFGHEAFLTQVL